MQYNTTQTLQNMSIYVTHIYLITYFILSTINSTVFIFFTWFIAINFVMMSIFALKLIKLTTKAVTVSDLFLLVTWNNAILEHETKVWMRFFQNLGPQRSRCCSMPDYCKFAAVTRHFIFTYLILNTE